MLIQTTLKICILHQYFVTDLQVFSADVEVTIEPIHMFDYRHKPLNRISLPQRPKWLSDSVKFIREFDPLASRIYERPQVDRIERFHPIDIAHSYERGRPHHDFEREGKEHDRSRRDYDRDNREYETEREDIRNEKKIYKNDRDNKFHGDHNNKVAIRSLKFQSDKNFADNTTDNSELKTNLKDSLEDLSDEDMDWEAGERTKLHDDSNKSRSNSPMLSNPPNPSNIVSDIEIIEDIINIPGRFNRPPRIVIILRGPPGSGKTYLAKLIKDKEV